MENRKITKAAVYAGTRNLYEDMVTAAKSLICNSSVEKVYFLIEDDAFPYELPEIIETRNVSGQGFFPKTGANHRTQFTYMSLLRVCYTKLFPELDRILQLDVDTIITDDLTDLWEMDVGDKWLAACPEHLGRWRPYGPKYYNIGVALFNLAQQRKDGIDRVIIRELATHFFRFLEQDAWNYYGVALNKFADIDVRYNECFATGRTDHPAIVHYAGFPSWMTMPELPRREYLDAYRKYYRL